MKRLTPAVILALAALASKPAAAQWTVIDPTNLVQNAMTAANSLEQISNQVQSLRHEAQMLENMTRNLTPLDYSALADIAAAAARVDALMQSAAEIAFSLDGTQAALAERFPAFPADTTSEAAMRARAQAESAMEALRHAMRVQAQVAENLYSDAPLIADLVSRSQSAPGALGAAQAGNQLAALAARQQLQMQAMIAAAERADALERARQAQALDAARAATRRFAGEASAYTPR